MSRAVSDRIPTLPFAELPIRIDEPRRHLTTLGRGLIILALVLACSVPVAGIAVASVESPGMLLVIAARPLAAAQIAVGVILWCALLALPASRLLKRLWSRRDVLIEGGVVNITDRSPLGESRRSVPLADYRGVAHHIRASLSSLTHEIVLVHADASATVTLVQADKVTESMLEDAKRLLGLPEVPARAIYERRGERHASSQDLLKPVGA